MKKKPKPKPKPKPTSDPAWMALVNQVRDLQNKVADLERANARSSSWEDSADQQNRREAEKHTAYMHFLKMRAELFATLKAQIQADRPAGQGR